MNHPEQQEQNMDTVEMTPEQQQQVADRLTTVCASDKVALTGTAARQLLRARLIGGSRSGLSRRGH